MTHHDYDADGTIRDEMLDAERDEQLKAAQPTAPPPRPANGKPDICPDCLGTGWVSDMGPGRQGREYAPCDCQNAKVAAHQPTAPEPTEADRDCAAQALEASHVADLANEPSLYPAAKVIAAHVARRCAEKDRRIAELEALKPDAYTESLRTQLSKIRNRMTRDDGIDPEAWWIELHADDLAQITLLLDSVPVNEQLSGTGTNMRAKTESKQPSPGHSELAALTAANEAQARELAELLEDKDNMNHKILLAIDLIKRAHAFINSVPIPEGLFNLVEFNDDACAFLDASRRANP